MEDIVVTLITSLSTLAGVIITVIWGNKKTEKKVKDHTDLTLYRIKQLEDKQDKHNSVIERMFKLEGKVNVVKKEVEGIADRVNKIEIRK